MLAVDVRAGDRCAGARPTTSSVPAISSTCSCSAIRTGTCGSSWVAMGESAFRNSDPSTSAAARLRRSRLTSSVACRCQMIGVRASVSMGDTRSIRVFVMGEANRPGSYTVSGLVDHHLGAVCHGRHQADRFTARHPAQAAGAVVRRIDLYDLLLRGDTSDDAKLLPGDVIFIPPVSATVAVDGEVQSAGDLRAQGRDQRRRCHPAGGWTHQRGRYQPRGAGARQRRSASVWCVDVPLDAARAAVSCCAEAILCACCGCVPTLDHGVTVEGHVFRPGPVAWHDGLRLTDVHRFGRRAASRTPISITC